MIQLLSSIPWLFIYLTCLFLLFFIFILPAYTLTLAAITFVRQRTNSKPWSNICTSIFRGSVFHIRHKPTIHSFSYPLFFSVVDLDEAHELFGESVCDVSDDGKSRPNGVCKESVQSKGRLWPLSTLMKLRDIDHLKNGEGQSSQYNQLSMKERIANLIYERTQRKVDFRSSMEDVSRKVLLVTHLMYYGYCFNPVSFFYVLKPSSTTNKQVEIEAVVVEVSNTPWNEMSIYVLHPDSVDVAECFVTPSKESDAFPSPKYRYIFRKNFHVSPFMTMDHDYDWTFQLSSGRISVLTKMIKREEQSKKDGELHFTAGFDISQTHATTYFPFQLATIICRFPIYCLIIQIWIHYEALRLLAKGVVFIPHPKGSESRASRAIAAVMAPVFLVKELLDKRFKRKAE